MTTSVLWDDEKYNAQISNGMIETNNYYLEGFDLKWFSPQDKRYYSSKFSGSMNLWKSSGVFESPSNVNMEAIFSDGRLKNLRISS